MDGQHGGLRRRPRRDEATAVALSVARAAKPERYDLLLVTQADGATATFPHWITVSDPLALRLTRQPDGQVTARIVNRSDKPFTGAVTFTVPKGMTLDATRRPFTIGAWAATEVSVQLSGLEPLQAPVHLLAEVKAGSATAQSSLMLYPPAPEWPFRAGTPRAKAVRTGGSAGRPGDAKAYSDHAVMDTKDPYDGKSCIRLDPHPEAGKAVFLRPIVQSINGGHKYHVKVAIRKTEDADVAYAQIHDHRLSGGTAGKWTLLEADITVAKTQGDISVQLVNESRHPVWFDALSVERVD